MVSNPVKPISWKPLSGGIGVGSTTGRFVACGKERCVEALACQQSPRFCGSLFHGGFWGHAIG